MYKLDLISPEGARLNLIADGAPGGIFVESDTIEALTGAFEDKPIQVIGEPGQVVDFRDRVVSPITGTIGVVVWDPTLWKGFRRAWSVWDNSVLELIIDARTYRLPCRLQNSFAFPASIPKRGDRISVPVISDRPGAWLVAGAGTSKVTVTNKGDIPISPEIVWNGAGGAVVLPSGATFTLPAVTSPHRLPLARSNSGRVLDANGNPDPALTKKTAAVAELVPRNATRIYTLPTGAKLMWDTGYFDPFREV